VNPKVRASSEISFKRGRFDGPIAIQKAHACIRQPTPRFHPSPEHCTSTRSPARSVPRPAPVPREQPIPVDASRPVQQQIGYIRTASAIPANRSHYDPQTGRQCSNYFCFNRRIIGVISRSRKCADRPGPFVHESIQIGSIRACPRWLRQLLRPDLSRAIPWYPNPARSPVPYQRPPHDHIESALTN